MVSAVMDILSDIIMNTKHKCAILLRLDITDFVSRTCDIKVTKTSLGKLCYILQILPYSL